MYVFLAVGLIIGLSIYLILLLYRLAPVLSGFQLASMVVNKPFEVF